MNMCIDTLKVYFLLYMKQPNSRISCNKIQPVIPSGKSIEMFGFYMYF